MSTQQDQGNQERPLDVMRHSASHVMAEAVQKLFPSAKFGIGPATQDGFYYDFELPRPLTDDDLPNIEAEMRRIVAADLPFTHEVVDKKKALSLFASQPYKVELIEDLADDALTVYRQSSFVDLCRGPHVSSTAGIKAFKLLSVAGAYWRGDEHRPMLQRIYGTAFATQQELDDHLFRIEEAARRDHRRLGKELDLFSFHEEAGAGLALWHPKGGLIRHLIETFWREEHLKRGYDIVYTPHIFKSDLWKISGHWENYRENMYSPMDIDGQDYIIKPMNCPGHLLMYKSRTRSYRDLPMRWAELGTVYRYERSGVLHGMARVRGFTQDDAHIFCRPDQLLDEVRGVVEFARYMMRCFGFKECDTYLATRPEKYVGSDQVWETATGTLIQALKDLSISYEVDPGGGVFYGPKIDMKLRDALGRGWQGPTVQVDFNLPQRFQIEYVGQDGQPCQPAMVHRTVLGSMERFFASLIEHHAGIFPLWLAPVQVLIVPIADRHVEYARKVAAELVADGLRAQVDARSERMNYKIREAQLQKIPFMLILGDNEAKANSLSVRRLSGEETRGVSVAELKATLLQIVQARQ